MGQHFDIRFVGGMGRPHHQRMTTSVLIVVPLEQPFNTLNERNWDQPSTDRCPSYGLDLAGAWTSKEK